MLLTRSSHHDDFVYVGSPQIRVHNLKNLKLCLKYNTNHRQFYNSVHYVVKCAKEMCYFVSQVENTRVSSKRRIAIKV
jgi:hypothetical protein